MDNYKTKELYDSIRDELADRGIYIDKSDIYILVQIIFKSIGDVLKNKDDIININKKINIKKIGNFYRFKIGNNIKDIPDRLNMSDKRNREIFNSIFLPLIEELNDLEEN